MRTIAEKQNRSKEPASSSLARPDKAAEHPVLHLQHTLGNQAVRRILHSAQAGVTVQRQPTPGTPPPAPAPLPRKWTDVFADLRHAIRTNDKGGIPALVQELTEVAERRDYDLDILSEGMAVVADLSKEGKIAEADRLLHAVHLQFMRAFLN